MRTSHNTYFTIYLKDIHYFSLTIFGDLLYNIIAEDWLSQHRYLLNSVQTKIPMAYAVVLGFKWSTTNIWDNCPASSSEPFRLLMQPEKLEDF